MTAPTGRRSLHDGIVDLAAIGAAVFIALLAAGEAESKGIITGDALFFALVLSWLGCLALWWRRRWPVGVALLLAAMLPVTEFVGGAVLVAIYTVTVSRSWRVTLALAGLHTLAYVPYTLMRPDPELPAVVLNAFNIALLAIAVAVGAVTRAGRETTAALLDRALRAGTEARLRADRARVLERERIAREMHDALAHRISLVSLHAGALEVRPDLPADEVARVAGTIRVGAHEALEDLREILGVLRAGPDGTGLRPQPGLTDLDELLAEVRATSTGVRLDNELPDTAPPPSVSRTAYRVVQEGLTNARKHAPGAEVQLRLGRTPGGDLHVRLRNPLAGAGGPAVPGARCGLVGLAERVSLTGGRLDHGARRTPDGAIVFDLEAWLPWPT